MPRTSAVSLLIACLCLLVPPPVTARTKLAALPERQSASLRLDNPSATLVEEQRVLTLQEGVNQVDFAWQGVQIDPDSIRIAFLSHPSQVALLAVAYPPAESALVWRIHSQGAWEEEVRITYLLAGIDRLVTYKALAEQDESRLDLEAYLVLRNFSGEDFSRAQLDTGSGDPVELPSAHEETRQVRLFRAEQVPIRKTLTWDAARHPWEPKRQAGEVAIPVHYEIDNAALRPGTGDGAALWPGKVRVYQHDGHGGTIFLGEDQAPHTPPGKTLRLHIGDSRDVVVTQQKEREQRINLRPSKYSVSLFDTDELLVTEVENFKNEPARVDLVQHIPGQWELVQTNHEFERKDAHTAVFHLEVPAEGRATVRFHYYRRNVRP